MLEIQGISKSFPGVKALDKVSFSVKHGEVHGLVGENGAGKSTLMHILAGVFPPDEGTLYLNGKPQKFENERSAQLAGIGMVFQEQSLVNNLSIAENIFAGRQPVKRFNWVDKKKMNQKATELLGQVGLNISPTLMVYNLTSIEKQLVEIAKSLSLDAKILILDEPTATITEKETDVLFKLIGNLRSRGISIIYISHRLQELHQICDTVSVLKDGVFQGTKTISEVTTSEIVKMMVGRVILNKYDDRDRGEPDVVLEVKNLSSTAFNDVSFILHHKEILGIAGLAGAGRTEIALSIFGNDPKTSGEIFIRGKKVSIKSPMAAIKNGIGYLTEDRKEMGLFLDLDVASNIVSANLPDFTVRGFLDDKQILNKAEVSVSNLRISTPSIKQKAINLSGGNQQKLLMARWLMRDCGILIIDEPTRGVDVGAKSEIYEMIRSMAKNGTSVIVISSELPEVLTLCDRIVVMWQGKLTGVLDHDEATEERIMRLASGLNL